MTKPLLSLADAASVFTAPSPLLTVDPLKRLFDPTFTDTLWEYEHSRTDPNIPGNLHARQVELLHAKARHRFAFWGNQVGKSTMGAIDLVLTALGRHPVDKWEPPTTQWASALTWELWENILLPELLTWIPKDRIVDSPEPYVHSTKRHIVIKADNGKLSRITGKAAEQGAAKYQSARINKAWLDEEHPEEIWNEMQPRLVRHGGRTINTMTPLKGLTWVYRRYYEGWRAGLSDPTQIFISHAGLADNPSISKTSLEALRTEFKHNPAMLAAREHGHFVRPEGVVLPFDTEKHLIDIPDQRVMELIEHGRPFGAIDFGLWRFAFTLWVPDRDGNLYLLDEHFSQREDLDTRARSVKALLAKYGITRLSIWGDCANPQDILELNNCFRRADSKLTVVGVEAENKLIKVGVERMENLLNRGALYVRRGIGSGRTWRLGWNASRPGDPIEGSRWIWEVNNWQYPKTDDGKVQKDQPDDATADGADMMASSRYAVMSWWKAAKPEAPGPWSSSSPEALKTEYEQKYTLKGREKRRKLQRKPVDPQFGRY